VLIVGLGGVVVVMGVIWWMFVVRSRGVTGSRGGGMVVSTDEVVKMASMDQFFYFVLECFAFFCSVAMVAKGNGKIWSCRHWGVWLSCVVEGLDRLGGLRLECGNGLL